MASPSFPVDIDILARNVVGSVPDPPHQPYSTHISFSEQRIQMTALNLTGSMLSVVGCGFILGCYLLLPMKPHFRHRLIANLAIADFCNALNNSISGLWTIIHKEEIPDGPACIANGFIGQLTVQATDFSILAIAIVTLLGLTKHAMLDNYTSNSRSKGREILTAASIWIIPFITAFTALGLKLYHPVSGNWCWIKSEPAYLRYVLTHMWRFSIIFAVIVIYTYLHFLIKKHFDRLLDMETAGSYPSVSSSSPRGRATSGCSTIKQFFQRFSKKGKNSGAGDEDEVEMGFAVEGAVYNHDHTGASKTTLGDSDIREEADNYRYFQGGNSARPDPLSISSGPKSTITAKFYDAKTGPSSSNIRDVTSESGSTIHVTQSITVDNTRFPSCTFDNNHNHNTDIETGTATKTAPLATFSNYVTPPRTTYQPPQASTTAVLDPWSEGRSAVKERAAKVHRVMLLRAYPIFYVLLWLPGIANRITEATGHKSKLLQIMQASTQFVGFANALTYGWNERIGKRIKESWVRTGRSVD